MRAEQTVSEMVVEVLARQADALSERTGSTFEEAFTKVLQTPAGRLLGELADGPHRHEKSADWQAGLVTDRETQRRPYRTREQEIQKRILLVEDDEGFMEVFARMLELELAPELNVAFAKADSLAAAHARLQEEDGLDAALIDVGLPDGDGLDLVRELRGGESRVPSLPTLVITANLDHSVATKAMEAGAMGVLSKMVSVRETAEMVQGLIGAGHSTG